MSTIVGAATDGGASQKNALIIGNSSYAFSPLKNPYNDANDFSKVLTELGYRTICLTNGSKDQMLNAVKSFENRLKSDGGIGLFYYAGHAVQFNDQNYLIPVDAKLEDTVSLSIHTLKLQTVLRLFETAGNETNIIILDACRNNPFNTYAQNKDGILTRSVGRSISVVPSRGLATVNTKPGSFIAYATAPGMEAEDGSGRNGVYTKYILKHIKTEGQTIEELFKKVRADVRKETGGSQIPWERSSLMDEFLFLKEKGETMRLLGKIVEINEEWNYIKIINHHNINLSPGERVFAKTNGVKNTLIVKKISGNTLSAVTYNDLSEYSVGQNIYTE